MSWSMSTLWTLEEQQSSRCRSLLSMMQSMSKTWWKKMSFAVVDGDLEVDEVEVDVVADVVVNVDVVVEVVDAVDVVEVVEGKLLE
eukprot:6479236-Amphidinium_carterae.1